MRAYFSDTFPNSRAYKVFIIRTKTIIELVNVVVDDHESTSFEIKKDDAKTKLPYSNETSQNESVFADDASPSSSTCLVAEGDPLSDDLTHKQGNHEVELITDGFVRESSK